MTSANLIQENNALQRCAIVLIKSELNFNCNQRIKILIDFHFSNEIEQLKK